MAKVLIVEDNKVLSRAYEMILKKEGHEVEVSYDGKEGLVQAASFKPTIILLDILMPKLDGLSFLEQYDLKNKHPETIVVMLTNIGDDKKVARAMELGAYKYIIKAHSSPAQLSVLVNHLINRNIEKKEEDEEEVGQ